MIEKGLHYHLGYKYKGQYKDRLEDGEWIITKNDVLFSTCEFKQGFQDGEMKMFNEAGEIICFVVFDKGEKCETLADILNVKEMTRVLEDLSKNYTDIWKVNNIDDDEMGFKGEGYLMEKKNKLFCRCDYFGIYINYTIIPIISITTEHSTSSTYPK